MCLNSDINNRLEFGLKKYGHGVDINGNMGKYTQSGMDSFLEMQIEEILDGIIYTVCSYLRIKTIEEYNELYKHNKIIKKIIENPDLIDIEDYKKLLIKMISVYNDTINLSHKMNSNYT